MLENILNVVGGILVAMLLLAFPIAVCRSAVDFYRTAKVALNILDFPEQRISVLKLLPRLLITGFWPVSFVIAAIAAITRYLLA